MSDSERPGKSLDPARVLPDSLSRGTPRRLAIGAAAVLTILAFLFAIRLLGTATEAASPVLRDVFATLVRSDHAALGAGWLATYLVTNGSVVAALAVTLFAAGIVTFTQLFMLVAGSRLGAAAIVLLFGGLEFVRRRHYSFRKATSLGVLAFLLTLSIYLPTTVLGYLSLPWVQPQLARVTRSLGLTFQPLTIFAGATDAVVDLLGAGPAFVAGVVLLYACLEVFDRLLGTVDPTTLRRHFFGRLRRHWLSFFVGLVVTGLTTSVAFSLGVVVAPYNRGYVERREIVPYVLGANIGTLLDTVVIAFVLGTEPGAVAVMGLVGWAILVTLIALVFYEQYFRAIEVVQDRLLDDRRSFAAFLATLVAIPLLLLVPLP